MTRSKTHSEKEDGEFEWNNNRMGKWDEKKDGRLSSQSEMGLKRRQGDRSQGASGVPGGRGRGVSLDKREATI